MKTLLKKQIPLVLAFLLIAFFSTTTAEAANFSAQKIIASAPTDKLDQLEVYSYTIGFKNTGTQTWTRTGASAVTVKTTEAIRVEHWFASSSWIDKVTVARSASETVKPGEVGFFTLVLQAPKTARTFTSPYALYSGNTKIAGTDFKTIITVSSKLAPTTKRVVPAMPVITTSSTSTTQKVSDVAKALLMIRSDRSLALNPGDEKQIIVGFKNVGERNWRNAAPSLVTLEVDPTSANGQNFNSGWANEKTVDTLDQALANIGELGYFTFKIKAPATPGDYNLRFRLVLNADALIPGGEITMPISVAAPYIPPSQPIITQAPPVSSSPSGIVCLAAVLASDGQVENPQETGICSPPHQEPMLRVGLASVQGQLGVTAQQPFQVMNGGQVVMNVDSGITVFLGFNPFDKSYTVIGPGPILNSPLPYSVRGAVEPSIITLLTFSNPVAYDTKLNDNVYRGSIEIQWSENDGKLWIINELPMEQYLRGLAESGNSAPMEFHKAQVIAARSYALYHYQTDSKHRARHFHVSATVSDQYYRGYTSEQRIPNIGLAAEATRGQVVTYQGNVVITPYSASSDGWTRTWSQVWGGSDKPWLVRKEVPEDKGRTKFGHAVGLSQLAAQDQAKAGKGYVEILKFFYVNTEVAQWYN